jgi:hypothetical protein
MNDVTGMDDIQKKGMGVLWEKSLDIQWIDRERRA